MTISRPEFNEYQFRDLIKFFNAKFEEGDPMRNWTAATVKNLRRIKKEQSIWTTAQKFKDDKEKCMVVVGASPKLKEDIEFLKELDGRFVLIVVNSALKMVLKEGIKPDFVVMVDVYDRHMVDHLAIDTGEFQWTSKDITLVTTNASSPKAIAKWKGPVLWMPYYSIAPQYRPKIRRLLGRKTPSGGNAFSYAASMCYDVWDARMFIFVGSEFCYDDQYYADKRSKWEKRDVMHFRVKDVKGRERFTNIPLYQYKLWMEKMIGELPHCTFIDTSDGLLGTDCPAVVHMDLPNAIAEVKRAFEIRYGDETDWVKREKAKYDLAYKIGEYCPNRGRETWKKLLKHVNVDHVKSALDVGCGFGQGVAMCRNKGIEAYGIDISESLTPYWEQGNITKFCKVARADEIPFEDKKFDLVMCVDVLEHIPEEVIPKTLEEMHRVGKRDFILDICVIPARSKFTIDGSEPHICIKPLNWWTERLKEAKFKVHDAIMNQDQSNIYIMATKGGKNGRGSLPCNSLFSQQRQAV